jgi:hypothetical protein
VALWVVTRWGTLEENGPEVLSAGSPPSKPITKHILLGSSGSGAIPGQQQYLIDGPRGPHPNPREGDWARPAGGWASGILRGQEMTILGSGESGIVINNKEVRSPLGRHDTPLETDTVYCHVTHISLESEPVRWLWWGEVWGHWVVMLVSIYSELVGTDRSVFLQCCMPSMYLYEKGAGSCPGPVSAAPAGIKNLSFGATRSWLWDAVTLWLKQSSQPSEPVLTCETEWQGLPHEAYLGLNEDLSVRCLTLAGVEEISHNV